MASAEADRLDDRARTIATAIYALCTLVFALTTAHERLFSHTPYNHFALQAEAIWHGRFDLGGPPPRYTGNNDFAQFQGKTFVSFPPFPALLIAPAVRFFGSAERTRDGLFFLAFAGLAPAFLYLTLDRLARSRRIFTTERENVGLAALFAFGTVYWFSAVQGTVWFVAHVVGCALACIYLWASFDLAHPALAGLALGLGFATRTPLGFAFPLFLIELVAAHRRGDLDRKAVATTFARFALPAAICLALCAWFNDARFGDPFEFGHRLLAIGWRGRIDRWGLFSYHYLGRNLAVVMTGLPFVGGHGAAPFQINGHGLALWITSPFYAWALWPKQMTATFRVLAVTAMAVAIPILSYQNSGWLQFGFRFSNDFAPLLVLMIAAGRRRLTPAFWALGAFAVVVNAFGAMTFQRAGYERFYFVDGSQRILHQPD
jgi:4-amino-4-deoxy-L-arabinose transferase-like glycosyltransferase